MAYNKYFLQKSMFATMLVIINVLLMSLAYTYSKRWYYVQIPLLIVLFYNIASIVLIIICALFKRSKRLSREMVPPTTVGYFIPCYNESTEEITNSLYSFFDQVDMHKHQQFYLTVCDGRKQGAGNALSTDKILKQQVFPNSQSVPVKAAYQDSEGNPLDIQLLTGVCPNGKPFFTIIKEKNCGKRDSIAIMRRLFYAFNNQRCPPMINPNLLNLFTDLMRTYGIYKIDFVIGVDADTVFEPDCSIELLCEICRKPNILATSGLVKVAWQENQSMYNRLWEGYQHVEYIAGQGLLRHQQNLTQQKINCLPGCLNITRVCEQTCGETLLGEYMKPPKFDDHIFQQIRATASEDRHSVMLLLKHYPKDHTTVNWYAQARTAVPNSYPVYLSQRRRWSLGSATHGSWMTFMPNIPIWERFSSLIFVITYLLNPFLLFSAVIWLYALINDNANTTFYILTGIVQALTLYKVLVAMWCPLTCWERVAYFLFYPLYYIIGPLFGVSVLCYSLYNMDDFGWGKTRTVIQQQSVVLDTTPQPVNMTSAPIYPKYADLSINNQIPSYGSYGYAPTSPTEHYIKSIPSPTAYSSFSPKSIPTTAYPFISPSVKMMAPLYNKSYVPSTATHIPSFPSMQTLNNAQSIPSIPSIPSMANLQRFPSQYQLNPITPTSFR